MIWFWCSGKEPYVTKWILLTRSMWTIEEVCQEVFCCDYFASLKLKLNYWLELTQYFWLVIFYCLILYPELWPTDFTQSARGLLLETNKDPFPGLASGSPKSKGTWEWNLENLPIICCHCSKCGHACGKGGLRLPVISVRNGVRVHIYRTVCRLFPLVSSLWPWISSRLLQGSLLPLSEPS